MNKLRDMEIQRSSSIVMASALEKIRMMYEFNPEEAGKFAIAYLEHLFTGEDSFGDDILIQTNLTELIKMGEKSNNRYDEKVENSNKNKYELAARLAGYVKSGLKQKEIAVREGKSESWVSGKMREAKNLYPEMFQESSVKNKKVQEIQKNLVNSFKF